VVLILSGTADVIFAVDLMPAIFAITKETLNKLLRGRIAALRGARSLA